MSACAPADKRTADETRAKQNIAAEIARICALPEPKRTDALTRLRKETGFELQCAHP